MDSDQDTSSGNLSNPARTGFWSARSESVVPFLTIHATIGPSNSTPMMLKTILVAPIKGLKTSTAIIRANKFRVEELCVIATVVSRLAPRLRKPLAMGTIHAEHRLTIGPIISPLNTPLIPVPVNRSATFGGNKNASVRPAITNANSIPIDTFCRYVIENVHHRSRKGFLSGLSIQKP